MNELAGRLRGEKEGKEENAEFEAGDHGEKKKEEENKTQGGGSGDVEMYKVVYKRPFSGVLRLHQYSVFCVKGTGSRERRHAATVLCCWFTPV